MRKPLPPEVLALIPNGIESLILRCMICGEALPNSRRAIGDHAGACHKVRVLHRRYMVNLTKCIACLHPATAEEREEYRRWRKHRGDTGERPGRQKKVLDKLPSRFDTPDIALCDVKSDEKPQGIV